MSEEQNGGFFSQIKNQIIAGVGVVVTAGGGLLVSNMEAIFAPEEPQQVVVQDTTKTQQPVININIPEQKTQTIIKEVPVKTEPKPTEKVYESW